VGKISWKISRRAGALLAKVLNKQNAQDIFMIRQKRRPSVFLAEAKIAKEKRRLERKSQRESRAAFDSYYENYPNR